MKFNCFPGILLICASLPVAYVYGSEDSFENGENLISLVNRDELSSFNDTTTTPSTELDSRLLTKEVHSNRCPEQKRHITFNFSNMNIEKFNEDIIETSDVVFLNLSHNNIRDLPQGAFKKLPNLQILDLSANFIQLEDVLKNHYMSNLVTLYINDNKRQDYYSGYGYDTTSRDMPIDMFSNSRVPFPKLENLYLRHITDINFPSPLSEFVPRLLHLDLSGNGIGFTDFLLHAPKTLSHLILDRNRFSYIPKNVFKNLIKLSLEQNHIDDLCFGDCGSHVLSLNGAEKLEWLNLAGNNIRYFVETDINLPQLRYLDLSNNSLSVLPHRTSTLQNLEHLVLSHNMLESIPTLCFVPNLRNLDLSNNLISILLPEFWCEHNMLEKLKLNRNMIRTIGAGTFNRLDTLVDLDLSENELISFSNDWIPALNYLEILRLNNDNITNLDDIPLLNLITLKELHVSGNPLTQLMKASIANLPSNFTIFLRPTDY